MKRVLVHLTAAAFAFGASLGAGCSHGRSRGPLLGAGAPAGGDARRAAGRDGRGGVAGRSRRRARHADPARRSRARQARQRARLLVGDARPAALRTADADTAKRIQTIARCPTRGTASAVSLRSSASAWHAKDGRGPRHPSVDSLKKGISAEQMVWPVEAERWTDEQPMPIIASRCAAPPPATADSDAVAAHARRDRARGRAGVVGGGAVARGAPRHAAAAGAGGGAQYRPRRGRRRQRAARTARTADRAPS